MSGKPLGSSGAFLPFAPAAGVPTGMRRTTSSVLASFTTTAKTPFSSALTAADSLPSAL